MKQVRFLEAAKRTALSVVRPLLQHHTYTVRRGLAKGLKRKGGLGFIPRLASPGREEEFLRHLDLEGKTVFDVGGFEGVFSMFFARAVGNSGMVVVFEPNPVNYQRILDNMALNRFGNVKVLPVALGREQGSASLTFDPLDTGRGRVQEKIREDIMQHRRARSVTVVIQTLDRLIADGALPRPDMVKIDVEGFEADVVLGMSAMMRESKPRLFLEVHDHLFPTSHDGSRGAAKLLQLLASNGYSVYHVENRRMVSPGGAPVLKGHLYCK